MRRVWIAFSVLLLAGLAAVALWSSDRGTEPSVPNAQVARDVPSAPRNSPPREAGVPARRERVAVSAASPSRTPPPAAASDAVEPTGSEPWIDDAGEPSPAFVRALIRDGIEERLPAYKLSSDEVERLADAVLSLRAAQNELRELPWEEENAERRRELLEVVEAAGGTFDEIVEMSPGELTQALEPDVGVDTGTDEGGDLPDPEFLPPR